MQRVDHRSITRIALQQVYSDIPEETVKRLEHASSKDEGFLRQHRLPERYGLKLIHADQDESRELLGLTYQEMLLQLADWYQLKQRKRIIATLGQLLHLIQEIGYYTSLIELDYEQQAPAVDDLIIRKRIAPEIYLYSLPEKNLSDKEMGILPVWNEKEIEERKDFSLRLSMQFLKISDEILRFLIL